MKITASDLDELVKRRRAVPKAKSSIGPPRATLFIPGALTNPLNASGWTWRKRSNWAGEWKEKVAQALLEAGYRRGFFDPARPKVVTFTANVRRLFDGDNLQAGLKPLRDALVENGLLSGDAPKHGHSFVYRQVLNRSWRGVEVRVEVR